jgi:hypothetical protein
LHELVESRAIRAQYEAARRPGGLPSALLAEFQREADVLLSVLDRAQEIRRETAAAWRQEQMEKLAREGRESP